MSATAPEFGDTTGTGPAPYHPISPRKFALLSVLTGGLYEAYWFYRNWRFVRERDRSDIWPIARAIFSPLFYPALITDIRNHSSRSPVGPGGAIAPSAFYLLLALAVSLPDPFWVISLLSVLALLPAVWRINSFTSEGSPEYIQNSSWRPRTFLLLAILAPVTILGAASATNLVPSTQVVPGWMVWPHDRAFLRKEGIVSPGEKILYFYSQDALSIRTDGNLLTERAVTSYWDDDDGFFIESAPFEEISDVSAEFGSALEDTVLTVLRSDGTEFIVVLSVEEKRDLLFLHALEKRIGTP